MQIFRIYQNRSKNGRYYISERVHTGNEFMHYGVKGMRWGVRKDQIKAGVKKAATKARDILYYNLEVENFEQLKQRGKELLKSPKGIAFLAAVVVLPDPLVFGGIAAYNALKAKGLMDKKAKYEDIYMKEIKHSNSLTHYGILGMKWGVRRTPEQLGHVKKGTKMYRVTPNPNEKEEGSTYVTYLQPDRDMYRGAFNKQGGFQRYYNLSPKDPMYESVYKLKEDLKVATYNIQRKVTNEVLKQNDEEMLKRLCEDNAKSRMEDFEKRIAATDKYRKENPDANLPTEEKLREIWLRGAKTGKEYTDMVLKDFRNMSPGELYRATASMFGTETLIKESVISELKKRGYNAMIDQASVGGGDEFSNIEGQAPMIIFDRGQSLDKLGSNKISKWTRDNAAANYMDWYWKMNSNEERIKNWANPKN